jgi:S-adenosylmethionine synthetase
MKTAESVTFAHPDKICDQISDAILDYLLEIDNTAKVAIETASGSNFVFITGETSVEQFDEDRIKEIVSYVFIEAGYDTYPKDILVKINKQSLEIRKGVDNDGAGDQGIMIGYATNETPNFITKEMYFARLLTDAMGRHDGKSQVTINEKGKIARIVTSLSSNGKDDDVKLDEVINSLKEHMIEKPLGEIWLKNPNGEWTISGVNADSGLTGRKIVNDAYGPNVPVGGGAFSGKDATKVDRSAAYMARKIAVELLKERNAKEVIVKIAYAIGVSNPVMAMAIIDGKKEELTQYDLRPSAIIKKLQLAKPQYYKLAKNGHFGRDYIWDN